MSKYLYILENRKVVKAGDFDDWCAWSNNEENKRVSLTEMGEIEVSTVFLAMSLPVYNHIKGEWQENYFETTVLKRGILEYRVLSKTWKEAEKKHKDTVKEYEPKKITEAKVLTTKTNVYEK